MSPTLLACISFVLALSSILRLATVVVNDTVRFYCSVTSATRLYCFLLLFEPTDNREETTKILRELFWRGKTSYKTRLLIHHLLNFQILLYLVNNLLAAQSLAIDTGNPRKGLAFLSLKTKERCANGRKSLFFPPQVADSSKHVFGRFQ